MIILMRVALVAAGSRGDVQPLLALGIGLRKRGHDVRLAAPAEFEPLVEAARLEYRYLPGGPATMRKVSTTAALAREIARSYDENLDELLKETAAACRSSDVVIDTANVAHRGHNQFRCAVVHSPTVANHTDRGLPGDALARLPDPRPVQPRV